MLDDADAAVNVANDVDNARGGIATRVVLHRGVGAGLVITAALPASRLLPEAKLALLHGPVECEIDTPDQLRRGEVGGLSALEDGLDDVRGQKRQRQHAADVAVIHPFALGERSDRCLAGEERVEAAIPPRDFLDQGRWATGSVRSEDNGPAIRATCR